MSGSWHLMVKNPDRGALDVTAPLSPLAGNIYVNVGMGSSEIAFTSANENPSIRFQSSN